MKELYIEQQIENLNKSLDAEVVLTEQTFPDPDSKEEDRFVQKMKTQIEGLTIQSHMM
jgi:hypothetical protein